MIRVCDAIMGSGKSESAIRYMNAHPEKRFVYVSPYLDEAARIKAGCPALHFVEPSDKIPEFEFSKAMHTMDLIKNGRNIASTHAALMWYTKETLDEIVSHGYTLIIDEEVTALEKDTALRLDDVLLAKEAGYIEEPEPGIFTYNDRPYDGNAFRRLFRMMQSRGILNLEENSHGKKRGSLFFWIFPENLLRAFDDVFILTYLFEGQELSSYMKLCGLEYETIGVRRTEDGGYEFSEQAEYVPEYVSRLSEMIQVVDAGRINKIGDKKTALSDNWYKTNEEGISQMSRNLSNFFNNVCRSIPQEEKMYGCFKRDRFSLRGKGYSSGYIVFNTKATNEYRHKTALAYCVNVFMNVAVRTFFARHGIIVDEDRYALSIMIQWIWRSAIRDGHPVTIYVPSSRMRALLLNWIETTQAGVSPC